METPLIDPTHWERLQAAEPEDVTRRSGARYDAEAGCYVLPVLNDVLAIHPVERQVRWAGEERAKPPGFHYWLLSVVYLMSARDLPLAGEWIPDRKLPYGQFFFRGPHQLPTARVAEAFGRDGRGFLEAALRIGGTKSAYGDYAAVLPLLPRVPLLYVLWEADDEFPARVSVLFDRTVAEHLAVDAVLAGCEVAGRALVGAKGE